MSFFLTNGYDTFELEKKTFVSLFRMIHPNVRISLYHSFEMTLHLCQDIYIHRVKINYFIQSITNF